jgi:hypothetical protein
MLTGHRKNTRERLLAAPIESATPHRSTSFELNEDLP